MLSLEELLAALRGRPDRSGLIRDFVPPPRFREKRFANYHPRHPTQEAAAARLAALAGQLPPKPSPGLLRGFLGRASRRGPGGVYLDGGFGVGKTHLLAAFWHAAPTPRAYFSFDELMYFIGLEGPAGAAEAFGGYRVVAVDEWELDDPGNLKMALAFLRRMVAGGVHVAVTSNTLPLELGAGRFSQKDFRSEIEELGGVFEVLRIEGDDYRHRRFEADPGRGYFVDPAAFARAAASAPPHALHAEFGPLVTALAGVHPIRYRELARAPEHLLLEGVEPLHRLPDALRWVHFVDSVYDAGVPLTASGGIALGAFFPDEALRGPYGKKLSRCLSRMEELLGEGSGRQTPLARDRV